MISLNPPRFLSHTPRKNNNNNNNNHNSLVNGFVLPAPSIPAGWAWLNKIAPTTWVLYGLAASQFGDDDTPVVVGGAETTVSAFLSSVFGWHYSTRWWALLIVVAWVVMLRVGSILALRYASFYKR